MEDNIFDKVTDVDLKQTMENSYIDYSMSVIVSRALPDIRDGLKPVQRRVLYSMYELNNYPDKPHRKCARIVGDTMGKFHPHGDSSIYGALVNMAQDWNTRYLLVDPHGNFGSEDGDGAAAMRYTEARLSKVSMKMLEDIEKDTVDLVPNFDESENEPAVLPARIPNLLVNGSSGIAVGMATNIPPHNLRETIGGVVKIIDNIVEEDRETEIDELLGIIKGPDFPTGATILGKGGIYDAYRTGRGKIKVRAKTEIETLPNGKNVIIVHELPYMVNKAKLVEKIAMLVKEKKVDGITDLRDESDREKGVRIVIELRKDVSANIVLNHLYKHTQLQDSFGVIMLALVDNQPRVLNLKQVLEEYLKHQENVETRRVKFDLNNAEKKAHILEGLMIALDNIDEVIKIIRASRTTNDAKEALMERFGFSDEQAQAIVDMRLKQLTGLEREKLAQELAQLREKIEYLKSLLADRKKLLGVIKEQLLLTADKYGDDRRTEIGFDTDDMSIEDFIPNDDNVITMTELGYIKRMTVDNFKAQNRGGKGIKGMNTINDDAIKKVFMTKAHDLLLFFSNMGRVYKMKCYEIPEAGRTARGTAIVNLLQLQKGERITSTIKIESLEAEDKYLVMATKLGVIKKTPVKAYANIRKVGIQAITLKEEDELIEVKETDDTRDILLITRKGMCIRFKETDIRITGRSAMGVRGIRLTGDDTVIAMQLNTQGDCLLFISEKGYGKRTYIDEFKNQYRGGKGIKCYKIAEKTGEIVACKAVRDDHQVLIITNQGIMIRVAVDGISIIGRSTSGVKVMNTGDDDSIKIAGMTKVLSKHFDEDEESEEETDETDESGTDNLDIDNSDTDNADTDNSDIQE